jgi:hypothetical protein
MANLPSGIGIVRPGGRPGDFKLPANLNLPAGGNGFLPGLPGPGAGPAPGPARAGGPKTAPIAYAAFNATPPLPTIGVGSQFNPTALFDLITQGLGPFGSPFAGSGLAGYPPSSPGAAGLPVPAGPPLSGAPLPRSGGKGVTG